MRESLCSMSKTAFFGGKKNKERNKRERGRKIEIHRLIGNQTDGQTDRQKDGQTDKHICRLRGFLYLESSFTISFCQQNVRPFFQPPRFFQLTHKVADNLRIGVQRLDCDKKRPFHHRKSAISSLLEVPNMMN